MHIPSLLPLILALPLAAAAQETRPSSRPTQPMPPQPAPVPAKSVETPLRAVAPLLEAMPFLQLDEMRLAEFCEILQEQILPDHVVIVVNQDVGDRPLSMTLRGVNALSAINLMQELTGVRVRFSTTRGFIDLENLFELDQEDFDEFVPGGGPLLLMVDASPQMPKRTTVSRGVQRQEPATGVYSITEVLRESELSVDDLATAVQTALPDPDQTVLLQIHEDTGLLICRGAENSLRVVDQILWQLDGGEDAVIRSMQARTGNLTVAPNRRDQERIEGLERALAICQDETQHQRAESRELTREMEQRLLESARSAAETEAQIKHSRQQWELEAKAKLMDQQAEFQDISAEMEARVKALQVEKKQLETVILEKNRLLDELNRRVSSRSMRDSLEAPPR